MEEYKIAIIGNGGIGSYLARNLKNLDNVGQLSGTGREVIITLFDDDTVDVKNLPYQDYEDYELTDYKAETLGDRYGWPYEITRVTEEVVLDKFDIIVAAVDNTPFRQMLYKWGEKNPDKFWIDLRSEGRTVVYYVKNKKNTVEKMNETLTETPEGGTSCQLAFELEAGIVQQGNKIIAAIGSQLILNYLRKEYSASHFSARF